jgi:hypothetical protein
MCCVLTDDCSLVFLIATISYGHFGVRRSPLTGHLWHAQLTVQEIPHHSTFSKNRHGRFQESKLFEDLFEQIVRQCVEVGLVQGKHLSVDGSFIGRIDADSPALNQPLFPHSR